MILYRYEHYTYRVDFDFLSNEPVAKVDINLHEFTVTRETPCGYWIEPYGVRKWISKTSTKRYAYPTLELAATSFYARLNRWQHKLNVQQAVITACKSATLPRSNPSLRALSI